MDVDLVVTDDVCGEFAERVVEAFHARPVEIFSLALSGGPLSADCYRHLARHGGTQIDWWKVDVYWTDEVCTPDDPALAPNYELVRAALLDRVGAANASYPMRCEDGPDAYQLRLGELGRLDVVHLTLGPDGTVAGLFPGSPALGADQGRLVATNRDPSGLHAGEHLTLTLPGIARARLALVTAQGDDTTEAVQRMLTGDVTLPAAAVRAEQVVCLADPAAASHST